MEIHLFKYYVFEVWNEYLLVRDIIIIVPSRGLDPLSLAVLSNSEITVIFKINESATWWRGELGRVNAKCKFPLQDHS